MMDASSSAAYRKLIGTVEKALGELEELRLMINRSLLDAHDVYNLMLNIRRGDYIPNNLCKEYGISQPRADEIKKRLVDNGEAVVGACGDLIRTGPVYEKGWDW